MDCLGNGREESRESKDTNRDHILAASLFGFKSTTRSNPPYHYYLLPTLLNVPQKYGGR